MRGAKFVAGGDTFTLRFSFGALCHYEDLTDKSLVEGLVELQEMEEKIKFKALVPIVQAGLFDSNPDMTERDVMQMDIQDVKSLIDAIGEAAQLAFPDEGEAKGNAPKGKRAA